jgi:hypothetical protein
MQNNAGKSEKEGIRRKPYEPPTLVAISLRPEEAVLGTCKSTHFAGPVSSQCSVMACRIIGS